MDIDVDGIAGDLMAINKEIQEAAMSVNKELNKELWDKHFPTNPAATKKINKGGRTITAIDAYHQIEEATDEWGPMGRWGLCDTTVNIVDQMACLTGSFFYPGGTFSVINSIDTFIRPRGKDARPDADWGKKLQTDTITKALSYLGFNADVFFGKFDDARYVAERTTQVLEDLYIEVNTILADKKVAGFVNDEQFEKLDARIRQLQAAKDIDGLTRAKAHVEGIQGEQSS